MNVVINEAGKVYITMTSYPTEEDSDGDGILDLEDQYRLKYNKWIEYDRKSAINYAIKWSYDTNQDFYSYSSDCTNFVSQCLYAGGYVMNSEWYSYKGEKLTFLETKMKDFIPILISADNYKYFYNWNVSDAWSCVRPFKNYIESSDYVNQVIVINNKTDFKEVIAKYDIQEGDPMLFDNNSDGIPNHATIISNVDNENGIINYAAHTNSRDYENVMNYLDDDNNYSAIIFLMKDGKIIYE